MAKRIVMAPLTGRRAYGPGEPPTELRASAGLIIAEAPSAIAAHGQTSPRKGHKDFQVRRS
ncbi:hypothetical protein [Rhodococcus tibetensis]|uniref:Uncharacterized protein n=1 Tax=Rhodococcus tibetensis TaxID=2965064 RepID=A0ABT1QL01_9NOCA|nr:hypothetical protein [Rhodococcus sp. FXJ9.536]MCQ4122338.1 hypothetical protein [Rhodococcus sp. FXJ9.536]